MHLLVPISVGNSAGTISISGPIDSKLPSIDRSTTDVNHSLAIKKEKWGELDNYLSALRQTPLLTHEQEIEYAKKIQCAKRTYVDSLLSNPLAVVELIEILEKVKDKHVDISVICGVSRMQMKMAEGIRTAIKDSWKSIQDFLKLNSTGQIVSDKCRSSFVNKVLSFNLREKTFNKIRRSIEADLKDSNIVKVRDKYDLLQQAKKNLVLANLRLVVSVAKGYKNRGLPFSDLIQEGNSGLLIAAEKYDHSRGTRFSTYAYYWIEQRIGRALEHKNDLVKVPVALKESHIKLNQLVCDLASSQRSSANSQTVMDSTGFSSEDIEDYFRLHTAPISLNDTLASGKGATIDLLADPAGNIGVIDRVHHAFLCEDIKIAMEKLMPRERMVLTLIYGLDGNVPVPPKELAQREGVSKQMIYKLEQRALRKLKVEPKVFQYSV